MIIPCYLALTAAEFIKAESIPEKCAYMACHFSCYGTGLSNLPEALPANSIIILNDRTPAFRHDPQQILFQTEQLVDQHKPSGFLLDFQRPPTPLTEEIARLLAQSLHCPVAVTLPYAEKITCPVFLAPPPLHMPLKDHIAPYADREIWLEMATETMQYIITDEGCMIQESEIVTLPEPVFTDDAAFCRYHIDIKDDRAEFTLQRTINEHTAILSENCNITKAIGLYQQLKNMPV